jgi:hypothetical protein
MIVLCQRLKWCPRVNFIRIFKIQTSEQVNAFTTSGSGKKRGLSAALESNDGTPASRCERLSIWLC